MSTELRNIAIYVLEGLLQTTYPSNVKIIRLPDDPSHSDYVDALRGQDAVISAVGYPAKLEEPKIIDAAVEAGVKRFIPSEYGINNTHPAARKLNPVFGSKADVLEYLQTKESAGLTWTVIPTGLWLDWIINLVAIFGGIDAKAHNATYWDDRNHRFSFTTLLWAAEAIAQILQHQELTANKIFPVRAFEASQRDIVTALEQAQDVKYEISHVDSKKRIEESTKKLSEGDNSAILPLIQAGFFVPRFGSNLVEEGIVEVGSNKLDLPRISLEGVVDEAVKAL